MKPAAKRTVEVKIQGREYRIRSEGSADAVRRAALLLDETMERVKLRAGTVDSVDVAVLAALNIANSLVAERDCSGASTLDDGRVARLVERIEAALGNPAARPN